MRKIFALMLGLLASTAFAASPLTCTDAAGNLFSFTVASPVVVTPPVVSPPSTGVVWGYKNGVMSWAGDFTQQNTTVNYHDTVGDPGSQDILFTQSASWGLYLPYFSGNFSYPNQGFKALTIDLKPTLPGQAWQLFFITVGDNALPNICTVVVPGKYGAATKVGGWATYVIPLKDVCQDAAASLYKFGLQDQTPGSPSKNAWYIRNMGFTQ